MALWKCCVSNCNSTSSTHRLFCMPTKIYLRNLWMSFLVPTNPSLLGLSESQLMRKRVCQKHFDETQFDQMGVRIRYSYPCLFTENEFIHGVPLSSEEYNVLNEHNYHHNRDPDDEETSTEVFVLGMPGIEMHSFPNPCSFKSPEIERFRTWVMRIGGNIVGKADQAIYNNARVCHRHFESRFIYPNGRLSRLAIPTLNLPFLEPSKSTAVTATVGMGTSNSIRNIPCSSILQDSAQIVNFDHIYIKKRIHIDHTYTKEQDIQDDAGWDHTFAAISGSNQNYIATLEKITPHTDHSYTKSEEKKVETQSTADVPAKKNDSKLDSNLKEDDAGIQTDTCDNDDLPPSPTEEFTTDIVSEIGDNIELENFKIDKIFSWQKSELIEADDSEDPKPAAVPEQPKIPKDLTLSLFCETEPLLQQAPSESVAVVPENVEYWCKDCAVVIDGFSWWCVQCACGALCCACAQRAPHDKHYVLRAPSAASHNQTQAVLAVIREQLLKENLLSLTDDDGVKVEVKQEPEERPPSPPLPAATPDPLAMELHNDPFTEESHTDPFDIESQPDTLNEEFHAVFTVDSDPEDPDPINVEAHPEVTTYERLDEETIIHPPFKRPRLMDRKMLKTNTVTSKDILQRSLLKLPERNQGESQKVQIASSKPGISQDVILATATEPSGSQTVFNITTSDPSGSQTVVQVTPSDLKRLQTFLQAATSVPKISRDMLNDITSDIKGLESILQVIPSDPTGSETVDPSDVSGSETVLQIDPSDLKRLQDLLNSESTGSETVLHVDPSNLSGSQIILQDDPSNQLESQAVLQLDLDDPKGLQDFLSACSNDPALSQTVLQIDRKDLRRLKDVLQGTTNNPLRPETVQQVDSSDLPKVTPSNRIGSQSLPKVTPSSLIASTSLSKATLSDRTGSKSLLKVRPSNHPGLQSLLKVTSSDRTGSRALPNIIARNRGASQSLLKVIPSNLTESPTPDKIQPSQLTMSRTLQKLQPSYLSSSKTQLKSQPSILRKPQTVLKLEKVQNIPKGAPVLRLRQNDPEGSKIEIPQNVPRGISIPLKVTSEPKPAETVTINLDDEVDEGDVEYLEEQILDSDNEDGLNKEIEHTDEDTVRNIESEVIEDIGDKRKDEKCRELKDDRDKDKHSDTNSSSEVGDKETRTEADSVRDFVDSDVDDSDLDKDYRIEEDTIEDDSMDETDVEDITERGVGRRTRNATIIPEKGPSDATLAKDYRVEEENIAEDSMDDTNVEDIAGSSIGKRTRHKAKTPTKSPSEATHKDYREEEENIAKDAIDETDVEDIAGKGVGRRTRNATKTSEKSPSEANLRMLTSKPVVQLEPLSSLDIKKWTTSRKRPRKD